MKITTQSSNVHLSNNSFFGILGKPLTSLTGTKPYMAPEVFHAAANTTRGLSGYSYPVDWWSLGVTAYEIKTGYRPYEIHSRTSLSTVISLFSSSGEGQEPTYSSKWSPEFTKFIQSLLSVRPETRISSLAAMKSTKLMANVNLISLQDKKLPPPFVPQVRNGKYTNFENIKSRLI